MEIQTCPDFALDLTFGVEFELGSLELPLGKALHLEPGVILKCNQTAGAPLHVQVGGVTLATAEAAIIDGKVRVRIKRLLSPKESASRFDGDL